MSFQIKRISALESACGAFTEPRDMEAASSDATKCRTVQRELLGDVQVVLIQLWTDESETRWTESLSCA